LKLGRSTHAWHPKSRPAAFARPISMKGRLKRTRNDDGGFESVRERLPSNSIAIIAGAQIQTRVGIELAVSSQRTRRKSRCLINRAGSRMTRPKIEAIPPSSSMCLRQPPAGFGPNAATPPDTLLEGVTDTNWRARERSANNWTAIFYFRGASASSASSNGFAWGSRLQKSLGLELFRNQPGWCFGTNRLFLGRSGRASRNRGGMRMIQPRCEQSVADGGIQSCGYSLGGANTHRQVRDDARGKHLEACCYEGSSPEGD